MHSVLMLRYARNCSPGEKGMIRQKNIFKLAVRFGACTMDSTDPFKTCEQPPFCRQASESDTPPLPAIGVEGNS